MNRKQTTSENTFKMVAAAEDYEAENHRELSFKQGDTVKLTFFHSKVDWWKGEFEGKVGYFPRRAIKVDWEMQEDTQDSTSHDFEMERKRYDLINQLINSEKEYIEDLKVLINHYIPNTPKFFTKENEIIYNIFFNIPTITEKVELFSSELTKKAKTTEEVGKCFSDLMSLYKDLIHSYIQNLPSRFVNLENYKDKNPKFAQFLIESEQKITQGKSIYGLLMQPLQRINHYIKFSKIVIKYFSSDQHPDAKIFQKLIDYLSELEEFSREKKFAIENIIKLADIKENVKVQGLVAETRKLEIELDVKEYVRSNSRNRKFYLFNDMILICAYNKKGEIEKSKQFLLSDVSLTDLQDQKEIRNAFELNHKGKDKKKFGFMSGTEKNLVLNRTKEIQKTFYSTDKSPSTKKNLF